MHSSLMHCSALELYGLLTLSVYGLFGLAIKGKAVIPRLFYFQQRESSDM